MLHGFIACSFTQVLRPTAAADAGLQGGGCGSEEAGGAARFARPRYTGRREHDHGEPCAEERPGEIM